MGAADCRVQVLTGPHEYVDVSASHPSGLGIWCGILPYRCYRGLVEARRVYVLHPINCRYFGAELCLAKWLSVRLD